MKTSPLFLTTLVLLLSACASPITREEAKNIEYTCTDVEENIALLLDEKASNNRRILSGVRSIVPFSVVTNVARGDYGENVSMATGEWAEVLDEKIAEMQSFHQQCQSIKS